MFRTPILSLLLFILFPVLAVSSEEDVVRCFQAYKTAILEEKPDDALALINQSTKRYYSDMLNKALYLSAAETRKLSPISKLMVLLTRHRVPAGELRSLNGESYFKYAVEKGWIGKNSVASLEIADVHINGDVATSDLEAGSNKLPAGFRFSNEGGQWKIDLLSMVTFSEQTMKSQIAQSGVNEDDYLLTLVETVSGKKPDSRIWEPVQ